MSDQEEQYPQLTEKQHRFVQEYLIDFNATQAAIRAGYSKESARTIGMENLTKPSIKAAIKAAQAEYAESVNISKERLLAEYAKVAFADLGQFVGFRTIKTMVGVDDETGEPVFDHQTVIDLKPSDEVETAAIQEIKQVKGNVTIKLYDKRGALDSISKMLGYLTDKAQVEHEGEVEIRVSFVDPEAEG